MRGSVGCRRGWGPGCISGLGHSLDRWLAAGALGCCGRGLLSGQTPPRKWAMPAVQGWHLAHPPGWGGGPASCPGGSRPGGQQFGRARRCHALWPVCPGLAALQLYIGNASCVPLCCVGAELKWFEVDKEDVITAKKTVLSAAGAEVPPEQVAGEQRGGIIRQLSIDKVDYPLRTGGLAEAGVVGVGNQSVAVCDS